VVATLHDVAGRHPMLSSHGLAGRHSALSLWGLASTPREIHLRPVHRWLWQCRLLLVHRLSRPRLPRLRLCLRSASSSGGALCSTLGPCPGSVVSLVLPLGQREFDGAPDSKCEKNLGMPKHVQTICSFTKTSEISLVNLQTSFHLLRKAPNPSLPLLRSGVHHFK
jgi:hypothetical protein